MRFVRHVGNVRLQAWGQIVRPDPEWRRRQVHTDNVPPQPVREVRVGRGTRIDRKARDRVKDLSPNRNSERRICIKADVYKVL